MTVMTIKYPYLPPGRTIQYVPADNRWMQEAREEARLHSLDDTMKTGAVIVKGNEIIGRGANGSDYHQKHVCERVRLNVPTGTGYDLCEGCHPKNHAERKAVFDAMKQGYDANDADLYLWGHWWACEPCWNAMIEAGISNVYLLQNSEMLFNKEHHDNIVGRQFA
jgi:deoxycytidylate deaminase